MSDGGRRYGGLSDEQLQEFHAACESFEQALQCGEVVLIEDYLTSSSHAIQELLFQELLAIELEGRLSLDRTSQIADYRARFPGRSVEIERVMQEVLGDTPLDDTAAEALLPVVYEELRQLASAKLANEKPGQTIQATALVHEAWIRLVGSHVEIHWNGRGHFFAAAARAMQRILVENARRKKSLKAGGDFSRVELSRMAAETRSRPVDVLELDEVLQQLESEDPRKAELVRLRFFAGLTLAEAARALGISASTADNDWAYAKAWLRVAMSEKD